MPIRNGREVAKPLLHVRIQGYASGAKFVDPDTGGHLESTQLFLKHDLPIKQFNPGRIKGLIGPFRRPGGILFLHRVCSSAYQ
jgi:hypothetical protein